MADVTRSVTWKAPEHHHIEKGSEWFWVLWIIATSAGAAAFFFDNLLLATFILIAAGVISIVANNEPEIIAYAVTNRGLRVGEKLFPYSTLEAFYIDEDAPRGPELLARSKRLFMPMIIMPIPEANIEDIEDVLESRLPEEHMEEPFASKLLEIFGF